MRQFPESLLDFIQKEEGNVQSVRNEATAKIKRNKRSEAESILKRIHPNNSGEGLVWGAYYDSRGYLTAGSGTLISKSKRGSPEEQADITKFKGTYGIDPFTMSKAQAKSLITVKLDENVNDYLRSTHGKGVNYDSLPDQAKLAVGSLAYNIGGANLGRVGKNYSSALKRAATEKTADAWKAFQSQQVNFHGKNIQEAGVMKRRQIEAKFLEDLMSPDSSISPEDTTGVMAPPAEAKPRDPAGVFDQVDDLFQPQEQEAPSITQSISDGLSVIASNLNPMSSAVATEVDPSTQLENLGNDPLPEGFELADQEGSGPLPAIGTEGTSLENTRFEQNQQQINASLAVENETVGESVGRFGDNLVNAFMTENIIGSTVKNLAVQWDVDQIVDPNFDPTKTLGYDELVKDIPTQDLKAVLESASNEDQFIAKTMSYKMEQQARQEMSEYMSTNPISGFVGIGVASALDVTSFIPVTRVARLAGLTKSFKGVPLMMRSVGAQVAENVVQDLIQESVLTANSDIRKWDDGDILYGMVGSVVLGGAAGAFKGNRVLNKFDKLAQRMNQEKNLDGINMMIKAATRKNLGEKTLKELNQVKKVIEQAYEKENKALVLQQVKARQADLAVGLKETKRIEAIKQDMELNTKYDAEIAKERATARQRIDQLKQEAKQAKQGNLASVEAMRKANKPIEKRLKKLKEMTPNAEISNEITELTRKLKSNNNRIKDGLKQSQTQYKRILMERTRLIRKLEKQGDDYTNDRIKQLNVEREAARNTLKQQLDEFNANVDAGVHPELDAVLDTASLNSIAKDLGLPESFKSVDDIDEFLGLKFDDSVGAKRASVDVNESQYLKSGEFSEVFDKTATELRGLVARQFRDSRENPAQGLASFQVSKNSVTAKIARATRLNKVLTTESVVGRFALNKSALRWSDNEFAAAFYNWAAPDGVGRSNGGKLAVIEQQQQLQAIYGGQLRQDLNSALEKLNPHMLNNPELRRALELPENDLAARLMMVEAYFPEKVSNLLRDELIDIGSARLRFGDEVGEIVEGWRSSFNKLSKQVLNDAKQAEVTGIDLVEETDNWFHRQWDNQAAIAFDIKHGTAKMEELIAKGMREHLEAQGKEVTEAVMKKIKGQAQRFAFGLRSKDTRVFMAADTDYQVFMRKLLESDSDGVLDEQLLRREINRIEQNVENRKKKELANRKPISLTASITLDDGSTFQIRDLLEGNVLASQSSYISSMAGRIASARAGIKDTDLLDEWVDRAVELERRRGNLDHANYMENAMREDIDALKYGHTHRSGDIDGAVGRLQRMAMKYNAARLMQYTGISSIAEMNTLVAEAGYKAVAQMIADNAKPLLKSYLLGGFDNSKVFRDAMYDELSVISGVGLEDISFDPILSSSRTIAASRAGKAFERVVDNAAKATRRTTAHVETTGRRLALNSLAINMGNIALGKDRVGNLWGGMSNVNLVELGLADLVNGKAVKNKQWESIMDAIRKNALDEDGNVASQSGKNIRQFNVAAWDLETRRKFGDVLTQQANHILVNPDSTTAKLWHNTWWGAMFNQFRSFANNATSKVAGHNLHQVAQGYRMGEMAEFSKTAQKYFWGAALGKLSLVTYGAINNAGREDFSERMEQYVGVDEFRDWTQALGRSSAITGIDSTVDTLIGLGNLTGHMQVDPLFESSTIGQSRDRFSWQTTATGQLVTGAASVGAGVLAGDFDKAGKTALKLSPFRRQLGVNQLLNAMGVD